MKTSSFLDYKGPGRISIARYAPRGTPAGFRSYKLLAPGRWFNSVDKPEYARLYLAQLAQLDATEVCLDLMRLADPHEPVLMCWETKSRIARGVAWCHRQFVAAWLKRELGMIVEEL